SRGFTLLSVPVDTVKIGECFFESFDKGFFTLTKPYAWVVIFFVGFVFSFRVSQLALQVSLALFIVFQYSFPECPLQIGIDIHFDSSITYRFTDLVLGRAATA